QPRVAHFRDHREAVHARQHHVQNHHVHGRRFRLQHFQRCFPCLHHLDLVALGLEIESQPFGQVLLVFHHQNAAHFTMGSSSTNVLPCPEPSLSAQTRPPCRLATER